MSHSTYIILSLLSWSQGFPSRHKFLLKHISTNSFSWAHILYSQYPSKSLSSCNFLISTRIIKAQEPSQWCLWSFYSAGYHIKRFIHWQLCNSTSLWRVHSITLSCLRLVLFGWSDNHWSSSSPTNTYNDSKFKQLEAVWFLKNHHSSLITSHSSLKIPQFPKPHMFGTLFSASHHSNISTFYGTHAWLLTQSLLLAYPQNPHSLPISSLLISPSPFSPVTLPKHKPEPIKIEEAPSPISTVTRAASSISPMCTGGEISSVVS